MARQSRQNTRNTPRFVGATREFLLSPRQTLSDWYVNYFRNQTAEFKFLVSLIFLMVGFGLVMVLSSSNVDSIKANGNAFYSFGVQTMWAVGGVFLMFFFSRRSIEQIQRIGLLIFLLGLIAQLLVKVPGIGVSSGGNANWINLFGNRVQPSEFLKLGLILVIANLLSRKIDYIEDLKESFVPVIFLTVITVGAVYLLGNDLGTAGVILLIVLFLLFLTGARMQHLLAYIAGMGLVFLVASVTSSNRMARIFSFLSQNTNDDTGWQVKHGTWALASGGITGTGIGQAKLNWGWIPEVENDFIFSTIGEETGLIGACVMLALFFVPYLLLRKIAKVHNDPYVSIVTYGVMLWIILQALINIGVVLHVMPVLGVPLPFISKGGSSLVAVLMGLGIVLSFERNSQPTTKLRSRTR